MNELSPMFQPRQKKTHEGIENSVKLENKRTYEIQERTGWREKAVPRVIDVKINKCFSSRRGWRAEPPVALYLFSVFTSHFPQRSAALYMAHCYVKAEEKNVLLITAEIIISFRSPRPFVTLDQGLEKVYPMTRQKMLIQCVFFATLSIRSRNR